LLAQQLADGLDLLPLLGVHLVDGHGRSFHEEEEGEVGVEEMVVWTVRSGGERSEGGLGEWPSERREYYKPSRAGRGPGCGRAVQLTRAVERVRDSELWRQRKRANGKPQRTFARASRLHRRLDVHFCWFSFLASAVRMLADSKQVTRVGQFKLKDHCQKKIWKHMYSTSGRYKSETIQCFSLALNKKLTPKFVLDRISCDW
jgi:hypothetical protein